MGNPGTGREADDRVRIAVFDFDGTCIDGNSPVLLVRHLALHGMLSPSVVGRILLWGAAYKLHLPQNESWVRGLVFSAFEGKPKSEVDDFLARFYDEKIDAIVRPRALAEIDRRRAQGMVIVSVSATFSPIVKRAIERRHLFDHGIATDMKVDEAGRYTREVACTPTEGAEKPLALARWADATYGEGNWVLAAAYGDHYSDRPLLESADAPYAVTPGPTLARFARETGWPILEW